MRKLRVGVIGIGVMGLQHMDAIVRQPNAQLVALADTDMVRMARMRGEWGVECFTDYIDMLERVPLDVVHNCTPNRRHYEVTMAAFKRGIHVYGENPLAATLTEGEALVRAAKEKFLGNAVNFNYRGNACLWEMRERLRISHPGRCFLLHGTYLQDWMLYAENYDSWVEEGGPRALADIASHWIDLAEFVYGKKICAVNASVFLAYTVRQAPLGKMKVSGEDGALLQFRFEDGVLGSLLVSQVSAGHKNDLTLCADCAKYSMRWHQQEGDKLILGRQERGEEVLRTDSQWMCDAAQPMIALPGGYTMGWPDALRNMVTEFYRNMRDPSNPCASFADGLHVMRVVCACVESAKKGTWVQVQGCPAPSAASQEDDEDENDWDEDDEDEDDGDA
jgi:predicted dehydrogenase